MADGLANAVVEVVFSMLSLSLRAFPFMCVLFGYAWSITLLVYCTTMEMGKMREEKTAAAKPKNERYKSIRHHFYYERSKYIYEIQVHAQAHCLCLVRE